MQAMVERAMADGAVGLSCGLGYFPGMIAKPAELAALARVAAAAGGVLTSHLRAYSERSLFFDSRTPHNILAVREMATVAREAGVPLQVSHLIFVGRRTWKTVDDTIAEVERHKNDGVDIAFDTFPYTCGNTTIRVIFPAWAQTGLEGLLDSIRRMDEIARRIPAAQDLHRRLGPAHVGGQAGAQLISKESSSARSPTSSSSIRSTRT